MPAPVPTPADVDRIAAMTDPVARNRDITAAYRALSAALVPALGASANWCTFAGWASDQAGSTIRGEDLSRAFDERVQGAAQLLDAAHEHAPRLRRIVREQAPLRRASEAVARGNLKVFAEIGRVFAVFLRAPVDEVIAQLRPGDPPDGQRYLREAFRAFADAAASSDPAMRAQHLLHANMLVGYHEQTRLQPEILGALDVARHDLERLRPLLLQALFPSWWQRGRAAVAGFFGLRMPADAALDRLIDTLCREARELMTAELMSLRLPEGPIRLGQDLPKPIPARLTQLTHPPLVALIARLDDGHARVADRDPDWADFDYRMYFIARLFRAYQEDQALLRV